MRKQEVLEWMRQEGACDAFFTWVMAQRARTAKALYIAAIEDIILGRRWLYSKLHLLDPWYALLDKYAPAYYDQAGKLDRDFSRRMEDLRISLRDQGKAIFEIQHVVDIHYTHFMDTVMRPLRLQHSRQTALPWPMVRNALKEEIYGS
jgi:hypothetical protein